jgi:ketosteroid isomerase-like protein
VNDADALSAVLAAERNRCDLIRKQDYAALGRLLHADLVHVHTRGNQDTRDSYLRYIAEVIEILDVERQDLSVKIYGDCAVMHGVQISTARSRKKAETVVVKTQALQVWIRADGWQQVAFQATALGDLPPPAPR